MNCNIAFDEVEDGWLSHDAWTDFLKFRLEHDEQLTDEQLRRLTDAMVKAGAVELIKIEKDVAK